MIKRLITTAIVSIATLGFHTPSYSIGISIDDSSYNGSAVGGAGASFGYSDPEWLDPISRTNNGFSASAKPAFTNTPQSATYKIGDIELSSLAATSTSRASVYGLLVFSLYETVKYEISGLFSATQTEGTPYVSLFSRLRDIPGYNDILTESDLFVMSDSNKSATVELDETNMLNGSPSTTPTTGSLTGILAPGDYEIFMDIDLDRSKASGTGYFQFKLEKMGPSPVPDSTPRLLTIFALLGVICLKRFQF